MTSINPDSRHYNDFLSMGISGFAKTARLTPKQSTPEEKAKVEQELRETYPEFYASLESAPGNQPSAASGGAADRAASANRQTVAEMDKARAERLSGWLHSTNTFLASQGLPLANTMEEAIMGITKAGEMPADPTPLEAVTGSGLKISVEHSWMYPEGHENELAYAERAYKVVLSREGEEVRSFTLKNDVRITELEDGTLDITELAEGQSVLEGTDGDDIILSQYAGEVRAGAGDDVIFALGDGIYDGGDGNDRFVVGGMRRGPAQADDGTRAASVNGRGATIRGGEGNDHVAGNYLVDADIDLGNGDNTVYSKSYVRNATIRAGNGDNQAFLQGLFDSEVDFGNGDNTVSVQWFRNSSLQLGHGGNDIYVGMLMDEGRSSITGGNGNNRIHVNFANNPKNHTFTIGVDNAANDSAALSADIKERYATLFSNLYA